MGGMVLVKHIEEEELLLVLVQEFAHKVVLPRNYVASEVFNKYKEKKIYGITGLEIDSEANEAIFQVELPPQFLNFIDYMILENRKSRQSQE